MDHPAPPAIVQDAPAGPRVVIGGEWRVRAEYQDAPEHGVTEDPRGRLLQRATLHADIDWPSGLRTFVEVADTRAFDDAPVSPADASGLDLQSAFVEATFEDALKITAGRQSVVFNPAQRFVSLREGPGVRRAFDGLRAVWSNAEWRVEVLASRPVRNAPDDFDDSANGAVSFNALYVSHGPARAAIEAYAFDYSNDAARLASASGRERRQTVGVRVAGAGAGIDYDLEAAYQLGNLDSRSIAAWAAGGVVGYTYGSAGAPRIGLEIELGSGDSDASDNRVETFNPLFPNGGVFDQFSLTSWANIAVARISVSARPWPQLRVGGSAATRHRMEREDGVYLNPVVPIPGTTTAGGRWLGFASRLDLEWTIRANLFLTGQALWSDSKGALASGGGRDGFHTFLALKAVF